MKKIIRWNLFRASFNDKQTTGFMDVIEGDEIILSQLRTLEQEMSNNETGDSCVMPGYYVVVPYTSSKFGKCFKVLDVPGRTGILFHVLNYYFQSEGCVGVGLGKGDINSDGYKDITDSGEAMKDLVRTCWHKDVKILLHIF